jgi:hypothetical protein
MSKLDQLMAREMTRRQFLITLGMGVVGLFGFSSLIGMLSHSDLSSGNNLVDYGMRNYGP